MISLVYDIFVDNLLFASMVILHCILVAVEGHLNIISCLLSEGADVTLKNNNGKTPMEKCLDTFWNKIVSLFNKYNS